MRSFPLSDGTVWRSASFGRSIRIAALGLLGALTGAAQTAAPTPYPAPGRMVDAGGYRVHVYCAGEGSPTVFVVGAGYSFDWELVQREVAKFARICTYDISGTAWSDRGPTMTCEARVKELDSVLRSPGMGGPYVLVGLSIGGLVERLYASRHPEQVTGMVIVDHAFTNPGGSPNASLPNRGDLDSPPVLIHQEPIQMTVEDSSNFKRLPKRNQELHRWADSLKPELATVETADECEAHLQAEIHSSRPLGEKPLAVVSTGNELINYKKLQEKLLGLSARSKQFLADESFHSVEIDQPEVVVAAIRWVLGR